MPRLLKWMHSFFTIRARPIMSCDPCRCQWGLECGRGPGGSSLRKFKCLLNLGGEGWGRSFLAIILTFTTDIFGGPLGNIKWRHFAFLVLCNESRRSPSLNLRFAITFIGAFFLTFLRIIASTFAFLHIFFIAVAILIVVPILIAFFITVAFFAFLFIPGCLAPTFVFGVRGR